MSDEPTSFDRIVKLVGLIATLLGIAGGIMGIIAFFKADATMQAFSHRARLQVTPIASPINFSSHDIATATPNPATFMHDQLHELSNKGMEEMNREFIKNLRNYVDEQQRHLEILNVGDLPAKNVTLTIRFVDVPTNKDLVSIEPPQQTDITNSGNTQFITFKDLVAPKDKIKVHIKSLFETIWIRNEFGETTTLSANSFPSTVFLGRDQIYLMGDVYEWNSKTNQWSVFPQVSPSPK